MEALGREREANPVRLSVGDGDLSGVPDDATDTLIVKVRVREE